MNAIIQTKKLRKSFKAEEVIKSVDFTLNQGEICALIGKNGAGKSTFSNYSRDKCFRQVGISSFLTKWDLT